ncbi:hypothetical protein HUB98_23625 [Paenibacillus barcinonensis]|uniref:PAS domain-containing protein n=1 Tax=Paenibacillus barcinonensis TaxID=198119 RepID=A0A2V4V1C1_PAEBA|nr:hypothetical protein [Paenibacillus barcinonensis]PYE45469.1 hypothetical protein DFQ00_11914 [Paenibacillus barcinonensis]QKS58912.1 hypothetical protein HUB98_23625 [Paenibacillus barcinonensis]
MRHMTSDLESLSFQSTNHQLIIIDQHWIIRSCNRAWERGFHKPFSQAGSRHKNYLHLMEAWTAQRDVPPTRFAQHLRHNIVPFKQAHTYDISVSTPFKEVKWFRVELTPLHDGSCFGDDLALIAHTDITEQKKTEQQLRQALIEARTLYGLLPICAVCKHIKDESNEWNSVEHYLEKHTSAEFTHDICPECIRRLYPKYSSILDKLH